MSGIIAASAISAVGAGYKIANGISQNSAAKKLQAGLVRPTYDINKQYYINQGLAENAAQDGLSESSLNFYGDQANRGLAAGINATLQGGGDVNNIGNLYDKYNQGNMSISAQDSQLKQRNLQYLVDQNSNLAAEENKAWAINKYEPYKDTTKAITATRNAAKQNIASGIGELGSVASNLYTNPSTTLDKPVGMYPDRTIQQEPIPFSQPTLINTTLPNGQAFVNNDIQLQQEAANHVLNTDYYNSPYFDSLNRYINAPIGKI